MTEDDFDAFSQIVLGFAELKGRLLSPAAVELYFRALRHWDLDDFRAAADHLVRVSEFMPGPDKFEALRKAGRPIVAEAWERARKSCGSAIRLGHVTHNGTCGDDLIDRAVRGIGGYGVIAMCETDKLPFLERRFAEHYEALEIVEEVRQGLPQIAHGEAPRMLSGPTQASSLLARLANGHGTKQ